MLIGEKLKNVYKDKCLRSFTYIMGDVVLKFHILSVEPNFMVRGSGYAGGQVSGVRFRVSGVGCQVSGVRAFGLMIVDC